MEKNTEEIKPIENTGYYDDYYEAEVLDADEKCPECGSTRVTKTLERNWTYMFECLECGSVWEN